MLLQVAGQHRPIMHVLPAPQSLPEHSMHLASLQVPNILPQAVVHITPSILATGVGIRAISHVGI